MLNDDITQYVTFQRLFSLQFTKNIYYIQLLF